MAAPINDEFFDKAVALSIASLDFAIEELDNSHSADADKFRELDEQYEEVEDIQEFKELNKKLVALTNDVFKNEELIKKDKEIYVSLHEAIYINENIETLLADESNGIKEKDAMNFLDDNFRSTIRDILDLKDVTDTLDDQMIKILEVLEKEKNLKDINEGMNIVMTSMVNSKKPINDFFETVVKADALESFLFFLNETEEDNK